MPIDRYTRRQRMAFIDEPQRHTQPIERCAVGEWMKLCEDRRFERLSGFRRLKPGVLWLDTALHSIPGNASEWQLADVVRRPSVTIPSPSIRNPTPRLMEGCVEPQHSKEIWKRTSGLPRHDRRQRIIAVRIFLSAHHAPQLPPLSQPD
jgi:hypothetical protein